MEFSKEVGELQMAVILKSDEKVVQVMTFAENYKIPKELIKTDLMVDNWEDIERFAFEEGARIADSVKRPRRVKKLYILYSVCQKAGVGEEFDFHCWAYSKKEVVEYARKHKIDWWLQLKAQVEQDDEIHDLDLDTAHPYEVLNCIDETYADGSESQAFRINEIEQKRIIDIRSVKRRKQK